MKREDTWKIILLGVITVFCFSTLAVALAGLQIYSLSSDEIDYSEVARSTMEKTIYEQGMRGQILDSSGNVLAYDKKIYNICFYRDPTSKREQNGEYSKAIWEVIRLARMEDKSVEFPFWLALDERGEWAFDTGSTDEYVMERRERMFRSNFYVSSVPLGQLYERLCYNYMIDEIDIDFPDNEKLTQEDKLQVLGVWQEMQMNAFNSIPITLVSDVKWKTMMEAETRGGQLPGISVSVKNQRVYPKGTFACHILGYTGLMQSESQLAEYLEKGYQRTDTIGMDGVEYSMEQWLTGNSTRRRGETIVEVDRSGRQIRELSKTEPVDGNTVKLTIDSDLQRVVEKALENIVNRIRNEQEKKVDDPQWLESKKEELQYYESIDRKIRYAQNGAIVVLDMNARVLAMASYPNYDPNLFIIGMDEDQRFRMLEDERNPLYNNAIKAADTPGSVFKMATALAALANDKITVSERISDGGPFTVYDIVNPPRCWISPNRLYVHEDLDLQGAIANSCNYYFYTIAARMGKDGEMLYRYAAKLGLTSKTNIDLPNEKKSVVGSQVSLYDPSKPISGYAQDTWLPVQVRDALKRHLYQCGERWSYNYEDDRLDRCVKALMDMAFSTDQGVEMNIWLREIRRILMEELNMTQEMAYRADIVSEVVRRLNEIKWGGSQTTMTAIGQSISLITPVAMARYVAALGNGGYVYDVQIIDSIISPTGEIIASFDKPVLVNDLSDEIGMYLPVILRGMEGVTSDETGTARKVFDKWDYQDDFGGKTGTAQKSKIDIENNSWFVAIAPIYDPEIAIVVYVPNGYSGAMSGYAVKEILNYYFEQLEAEDVFIMPLPNALAQ
ncbi:MAG: penicillin-binding transpeptidase domain-containing protein [Clostridia bacterium]|nr:penicillin-binding transpeptidase domain-containing protein [Clostridia bacterium]